MRQTKDYVSELWRISSSHEFDDIGSNHVLMQTNLRKIIDFALSDRLNLAHKLCIETQSLRSRPDKFTVLPGDPNCLFISTTIGASSSMTVHSRYGEHRTLRYFEKQMIETS